MTITITTAATARASGRASGSTTKELRVAPVNTIAPPGGRVEPEQPVHPDAGERHHREEHDHDQQRRHH